MDPRTVERLEAELKKVYAGATSALDAGRVLIKLPEIHFPAGCRPGTARALVIIDPAANAPELYLSEIPTLATGARPSAGDAVIAGEAWKTYSFALRGWNPTMNTGEQFVQGKLRRFALGT